MKSQLLVFFQFIFMIKHARYTCTLRGNDTSRTEYGYDNAISRHFNIFLSLHNLMKAYVPATAIIEIIPYSNSIIIF